MVKGHFRNFSLFYIKPKETFQGILVTFFWSYLATKVSELVFSNIKLD
jgi:hypothetical protein